MRRVLAVVALLALAVLPAGCSGTPPEGDAAATASRPPTAGEIRLVITRDYGASLLKDVLVDAGGGTDVMRVLAENTEVSSGYGGGFVAGIDGLESTYGGASSADAADWFYWVDGALADIGAGDYPLGGGETVWWDYHRWAGAMFAPTAVHAFPVPWAGRPLPVTGGGEIAGLDEWAPTVGLELGQRRDLAAGRPPDGLVVCTAAEAAATPWLAALLSGEAGAPLVAVGDGTLSALGADGATAAATAAVLALPNADDPARPLLLLLFADAAAAGDALPLFTPASLGARLAAAAVGGAVVPLPLQATP